MSDLESLHTGRIDDFVAGLPVLRAADMTNAMTNSAHHNQQSTPDLIAHFRDTRAKFVNKIEALDELHFEKKSLHPRLQQMASIADILFFAAEHDTHHLTKIAGITRA